ncbi:hypothetical protein EG68_01589, partial [Paragonimus skrjabini miyazakii]
MQTHAFGLVCRLADFCLNHVTSADAKCIAFHTSIRLTTRVFKRQSQLQEPSVHRRHKMRAVPVVMSLLVLLDGVLAQDGSAPRTFTSEFSGFLRYNLTQVREPEKLVQENKTMQVQTDVCDQITNLVPWYQAQKNTSTCTIKIGKLKTFVNYTILATDDFLRNFDPSCVTYDILLASQVWLSSAFGDKYYLLDTVLENRNRTQPVGPCKL